MSIRKTGLCLLGVSLVCLLNACSKSDANAASSGSTRPAAAIHWLGIGRVATDTNAAGFLRIWELPETERLKAQTLDKLALAPWGLPATNRQANITNYSALVRANGPASLLRVVLEDLVQDEWYLQIRDTSANSGQLALAARLKPGRAGIWETNLGLVFESLAGAKRTPVKSGSDARGWEITGPSLPAPARHAQLVRAGQWTILGLAPAQNQLFTEAVARVQKNQEPFTAADTKAWLDAALDLPRLSKLFSWGWDLPQGWPEIAIALNGDGKNVVTHGHLSFPQPLPEIEPWKIPASLLHEPMHSFTAVQGLSPWLSSWPAWQNLHAGPPPNQLFCWARGSSPFLSYAAAPLADAGSAITKIGPAIMESFNPLLASNRMGKWERSTNSDGINWDRVPIIQPFIQSTRLADGQFLFGGVSPLIGTNTPAPAGTLKDLAAKPNVIYFDRELSGPRAEAWMYLSQLSRMILRRTQLPPDGTSLIWLKVCAPLLGPASTTVTKTGATELSLARTSTVGFTGVELQLLADWLESPCFPFQPHTVVSKMPPLPSRRGPALSGP